MDGIAISSEIFKKGQKSFEIEGIQPAGSKQITLQNKHNCVEAMTGAILPLNADAVIPYEQVKIENDIATVLIDEVNSFKNIHKKGFDKKQGDVLIEENTTISPAEIAVLATVGKSTVKVAKQPKVIIISTGDELVEVNEQPKDYQIRRSNVYTLATLLEKFKINADTAHILDDKDALKSEISAFLNEYDVLLFSGAVSKGKFDFIPQVLDELGVKKLFHKVKQKPGKPFWFGKKENTTIFAFPGNPVSTFVSCVKYFNPWYLKSVGLPIENHFAFLSEDFSFKQGLTYFLQVKLFTEEGKIYAKPLMGKGSGDLANLVEANGFLELPDDRSNFTKGEQFPIMAYRSII